MIYCSHILHVDRHVHASTVHQSVIEGQGIIFLFIGTIYNLIIAKWFMPSRSIISSLTRKYHMGLFLTEFKISQKSSLIGKTFKELKITDRFNLQLYKIINL